MSQPITEYTTYDDIRAALGVTSDDLEDDTLALDLYSDYLEVEFEDVSLSFASTYSTVKAVATPTEAQARFLSASRLFATFALAKQLTAALPVFAPKQIGDGKTTMQRFDTSTRDAVKRIDDQYGRMKARLMTALSALGTGSGSSTPLSYFNAVSPSTDPVTE